MTTMIDEAPRVSARPQARFFYVYMAASCVGRVGHGLVLPAVDRIDVLVAAPVHVGLPRALHAVVRLGLRRLVELSVLQRELRLGRLVPPGRLGPARPRRRVAAAAGGGRRGWFGPGGYRPPTVIANHYWGNRPGGIRPPGWNRACRRAALGRFPARGRGRVRPAIGFHPPVKDIRPVRVQNNIYTRHARARARRSEAARARRDAAERTVRTTCTRDRNGEVYRKTKDGWQQRDKDAWRSPGGAAKPAHPGARGAAREAERAPVGSASSGAGARPAPAARAEAGAGARLLGAAARRGALAELVAARSAAGGSAPAPQQSRPAPQQSRPAPQQSRPAPEKKQH